jgi:hypothetical protein
VLALATGLAGCADRTLTPPQEAKALHGVYDGIAAPAATCIETPVCKAKAGEAIKKADAVAFSYLESTNKAAQDWNDASPEDKAAKKSTFDQLMAFAKNAVAAFAAAF